MGRYPHLPTWSLINKNGHRQPLIGRPTCPTRCRSAASRATPSCADNAQTSGREYAIHHHRVNTRATNTAEYGGRRRKTAERWRKTAERRRKDGGRRRKDGGRRRSGRALSSASWSPGIRPPASKPTRACTSASPSRSMWWRRLNSSISFPPAGAMPRAATVASSAA